MSSSVSLSFPSARCFCRSCSHAGEHLMKLNWISFCFLKCYLKLLLRLLPVDICKLFPPSPFFLRICMRLKHKTGTKHTCQQQTMHHQFFIHINVNFSSTITLCVSVENLLFYLLRVREFLIKTMPKLCSKSSWWIRKSCSSFLDGAERLRKTKKVGERWWRKSKNSNTKLRSVMIIFNYDSSRTKEILWKAKGKRRQKIYCNWQAIEQRIEHALSSLSIKLLRDFCAVPIGCDCQGIVEKLKGFLDKKLEKSWGFHQFLKDAILECLGKR